MKAPLFIDTRDWPLGKDRLHSLVEATGAEPVPSGKPAFPEGAMILGYSSVGLGLWRAGIRESPVIVDFIGGKAGHRRRFGGGKGQDIAKAVGLNKGVKPSVLDATGGLGRDAFVLASLGCQVTLIERSPVIAALLDDGLQRAALNAEVGEIADRIHLQNADSVETMESMKNRRQTVDVVYLDPMFPHRDKSALVKKEMRLFQDLVGADMDSDGLLQPALDLAEYRVVVKRPRKAPDLGDQEPTYRLEGKSCRYDIHALKGFA